MSIKENEVFYRFPQSQAEDAHWDKEWAQDWQKIVEIYATIEHLEHLFDSLAVSDYRRITQKQLILNLEKYAYSLLKVIAEKYAD